MNVTTPMPSTQRRRICAASALAVLVALTPAVHGQALDFPSRPVRIVLPLLPGTAGDMHARLLAERLSKQWNQPVVVENKPGGSSIIGTDLVAKAAPDGHTLLANITLIIQNPLLRKKLPYDAKDLVPVTQLHRQQLSILARADLPVKSVAELLDYAKANPGKINFGTFGIASTAHLMLEKIQLDKGVRMTHVPYKGSAEIMKALLAGEVDIGVSDFVAPAPHIKSGRLRVIGVSGPERAPFQPQAQTLAEAGVQGFEGYNWIGLFAPAGTPPDILRKISADIHRINADPAVKKRLVEDWFVLPSETATPEEFRKIVEQDSATWASVIKRTGVTLEP